MDKDTLSDLLIPLAAILTVCGGLVRIGLVALRGRHRLRSRIVEHAEGGPR